MKFIITYTNYKTRQIYTSNIYYTFKNRSAIQSDISTYKIVPHKTYKIHKTFNLKKNIKKYTDNNEYINYRVELVSQDDNKKKYTDNELLINNICDVLFINILESDVVNNKLSIMIDKDKIKLFENSFIPNIEIDIQIYDTDNIFDKINKIMLD